MDLIIDKQDELEALCRQHRVATLEVFGSAVTDAFDPETSDLDFIVVFAKMTPTEKADCYFGLLAGLQALYGRPVDLVTLSSVTNPYIRASVEATKRVLYAAA